MFQLGGSFKLFMEAPARHKGEARPQRHTEHHGSPVPNRSAFCPRPSNGSNWVLYTDVLSDQNPLRGPPRACPPRDRRRGPRHYRCYRSPLPHRQDANCWCYRPGGPQAALRCRPRPRGSPGRERGPTALSHSPTNTYQPGPRAAEERWCCHLPADAAPTGPAH